MDLQLLDEFSDSSDSDDGSDISDEEEEEEDGEDEDEREEWEDEEVDISAKNTDPAPRRSKRTRGPNHLYDEPYGGVSTSARTPRSKEAVSVPFLLGQLSPIPIYKKSNKCQDDIRSGGQ